jgi:hypothetical protein
MNEEEVEVDLEGELISALEEIDRLRQKKRKQKELLIKYEKGQNEPNEDFLF